MRRGDSPQSRLSTLSNTTRTSDNSFVGFSELPLPGSILSRVHRTRLDLISGLESKRHETGWYDPTANTEQALWTCLEVCRALLQEREPIPNLNRILKAIEDQSLPPDRLEMISKAIKGKEISSDDLIGWESEGVPGSISTYLTSDAGLLFLYLGRLDKLSKVLNTLQWMQHGDGGWGVCHDDSISRTKATAWVLMLYSRCLKAESEAFRLLDFNSYILGIQWLNSHQNQNGGWGNIDHGQGKISSVSCTAVVLYSLLTTKKALEIHPNNRISIQENVIRDGLEWLTKGDKNKDNGGFWVGEIEGFSIPASGMPLGSVSARYHVSGGLGTLFVAQVLIAAARLGYIKPEDPCLWLAINNILDRAKQYPPNTGRWIVPSDSDDPAPNSWNSAFALDAFHDFETLYLEYLRQNFIEANSIRPFHEEIRALHRALHEKIRNWRFFSFFLLILISLIILVPKLSFLGYPIDWFSSQPALIQGLILMVLSVIFTPPLGRVASWIWSAFRRIRKMFE